MVRTASSLGRSPVLEERDIRLPPELEESYSPIEELGSGGQAVAWRARRDESGTDVVVKQLALHAAPDWKAIELFEREAETLETLDHPQIPDYVDYHHLEDARDGEAAFYLVQEYVEGRELECELESGTAFDEREVRRILEELLEVTSYLHDHTPPVVHRDIKPSNIVLRDDGPLALVDFGAVQLVAQDTAGGSTIIGTTGYLPVEQLMGRASPPSDIYAIGATALHLLTRRHPSELEVARNRLRFRDATSVSDELARWLDHMIAPAAEDRFSDAGEALEALRSGRIDAEPLPARRAPSNVTAADLHSELEHYRDDRYLSPDTLVDAPWTQLEHVSAVDSLYSVGTPRARESNSPISYRNCSLLNKNDALVVSTDFPGPKLATAILVTVVVGGGLLVNPVLWAGAAVFRKFYRKDLRLHLDDEGFRLESGFFDYDTVESGSWESLEGFEADGIHVHALPEEDEPLQVAELEGRETAEWLADRLDEMCRKRRE